MQDDDIHIKAKVVGWNLIWFLSMILLSCKVKGIDLIHYWLKPQSRVGHKEALMWVKNSHEGYVEIYWTKWQAISCKSSSSEEEKQAIS